MLERKVLELENSISRADIAITKKITDGSDGLDAANARIDAMERTLPQRIHDMGVQQNTIIATFNAVTAQINQKMEAIE